MTWKWSVLKARPVAPERVGQTTSHILAAYGELMERYPTAILDTMMLPLPKIDMKRVLKTAWARETDAKNRNFLEVAFIGLSNFEDDVGEKPIDCILPSEGDTSKTSEILTLWLSYASRVESEAAELMAELKGFKD